MGKRSGPRLAALIFYVLSEDFERSSANRTEEEAARPKSAGMLTVVYGTKTIQHGSRALAFESTHQIAQDDSEGAYGYGLLLRSIP